MCGVWGWKENTRRGTRRVTGSGSWKPRRVPGPWEAAPQAVRAWLCLQRNQKSDIYDNENLYSSLKWSEKASRCILFPQAVLPKSLWSERGSRTLILGLPWFLLPSLPPVQSALRWLPEHCWPRCGVGTRLPWKARVCWRWGRWARVVAEGDYSRKSGESRWGRFER